MGITNLNKTAAYETWATITTTWGSDTRTWLDMTSIIDNQATVSPSLTNVSKTSSATIGIGPPFGPWIWLTYADAVSGSTFTNLSKPS